ncbi:MAG TPA: flagellar hook-length control protein FliK [Geobacteraceae bacterium]|nr:flagellar hook-length control protein FliK [Geobacteraceae bacterium]
MSINNIIQNLAQIVSNTPQFSTVEAERQNSGTLQLAPGQTLQAEVLAALPNNRFLARIAGELFGIEIPIIVQPGETLEMTYVTGEPRPTFSLSISGSSGTSTRISDVGKWLSQLASDNQPKEQTAVLPRRDFILDGPPEDAGALANQLREALSQSGVFYESHLMQCFLGERQIRDLLREPQGKLSQITKGNPKTDSPDSRAAAGEEEAASHLTEDDLPRLTAGCKPFGPGDYVHPSAMALVKEQLQTVSTGIFAWHGQVWPEQQMDWTVCEREAQNGESTDKEWETTLNLALPNMGGISSVLRLKKDGLHLSITTDRKASADSMRDERDNLAQAMAEAGVKLMEMVIEHEEPGT